MPKNTNPRLLLAKVRGADYAHPGDEEAINLVLNDIFSKIQFENNLTILDVGCGLGGTASYLNKKTSLNVTGIDISKESINHAKKHYPNIPFIESNILEASKNLNEKFNIIVLFNVFYAIKDQEKCLQELAFLAKPNCILAIFDYTTLTNENLNLKDLTNNEMHPISLDTLNNSLKQTNWELIDIRNLNNEYINWYSQFLSKLEQEKDVLLNELTAEAYDKVHETFITLNNLFKNKKMGGGIVYAQLKSSGNFLFKETNKDAQQEINIKINSKL